MHHLFQRILQIVRQLVPGGMLCLLLILFFCPVLPPSIVVSLGERVIYEKNVSRDSTCEICFQHSYNKGMMREVYLLDPLEEKLTLSEGYFENYGAGMLDIIPPGAVLREEEDFFVISFEPSWVGQIGYVVGPIAKHVFRYQDDLIPLYELAPQKQVILSVRRRSLYKRLTHLL